MLVQGLVVYFAIFLSEEGTVFRKWDVKRLTWEEDTEPFSVDRDKKIRKIAEV